MKINDRNDITSRLHTDKQMVSPRMNITKKKMPNKKSFLPFINERDNLGRLIIIETEKKLLKNTIFTHHRDLDLPRKGILSKMYKESLNMRLISPTKSESRIKEDLEIDKSLGLYSPMKTRIPQESPGIILSDDIYIEQNSKIKQNFERFNNHKNKDSTNEKRKKYQSQGSQLKLLSPREIKSQFALPYGIYDVESSKNYLERKSPRCLIIQEHSPRSIQNYRPPSPERIMVLHKSTPKIDESESEFKKMMAELKNQVKSTNLPSKEEIYGKSPFNILSQDTNHVDLMRFNQNMVNKFEETRMRLHNLKLRINDVTMPSSTKEWK